MIAKKSTKKKTKKAKRKKAAAPAKKRQRRTDEQLIKDLQAKIDSVKGRAATRELKRSPALKAAIAAVRSIDRALATAARTALRNNPCISRTQSKRCLRISRISFR